MKVLVVGGGTAGLASALILKKHLNIQVDVVQSSKIGIVGVGEGSTEHFNEFMTFIGIDHHALIKECDVTYKAGIMFEGWTENNYLHSVTSPYISKYAQHNYVYLKEISEDSKYINSKLIWENKIPKHYLVDKNNPPYNQFHFNTFKLNDFLSKISMSMGINIFDDEIKDIEIDENGYIVKIHGDKKQYEYDFYIDSTGFKKLLIDKLGGKWNSFDKYLKMKAAITFPTEDEDNYNLWTVAKTMNSGWMFKLPVWGRHGNGYIYDSDYIDSDGAKKEVESIYGKEIQFGKEFSFKSGALEKPWINNCVAIGLSSIFVEPLEASSIGSSIQQAFLLMHRLIGYDQTSIKKYNDAFNSIAINIRDFIALHYITNKNDTEFWQNIKRLELPESLYNNLSHWKNHLPIREDFSTGSQYLMFTEAHHTNVMHGLNLFNIESIKKQYEYLPSNVKQNANTIISNQTLNDNSVETYTHKEYLNIIRNYL